MASIVPADQARIAETEAREGTRRLIWATFAGVSIFAAIWFVTRRDDEE